MWGSNIRKAVMARAEQRISEGQKEYDEEAKAADARLAEGVRALTTACSNAKSDAELRIVSSIIG